MLPSTPFTSPNLYSRKLLLHNDPGATATAPALSGSGNGSTAVPTFSSFDANVIAILAALVCAVVAGLVLNTIIRCALWMWFWHEPRSRTGVKKKALRALPTLVYSTGLGLPGSGSECAICLSEFAPGERVRVLPKCNHRFHERCVDRWLVAHSSCPTCRQCSFGTSQLVSGRTGPGPALLDQEDLVDNHRGCL